MTQGKWLGAVLFALAVSLFVAPIAGRFLCKRWELVKPNFQGVPIPAALGLTFLCSACPTYGILLALGHPIAPSFVGAFTLTTAGFGLLGLLDDKWGSRDVGGFKGHIMAILRGKPTTGGAKLVGGGLFALCAAWLTASGRNDSPSPLVWLVDAAVIALAANSLNLLDVRPGRALFGFGVLSSAAAIGTVWAILQDAADAQTAAPGFLLFAPLVLAALRETLPDARARGMLGDTGSNLLGASAGLACVFALPLWGRIVLLLLLFALNALAERVSLSALINKTPVLRTLDGRLGVR